MIQSPVSMGNVNGAIAGLSGYRYRTINDDGRLAGLGFPWGIILAGVSAVTGAIAGKKKKAPGPAPGPAPAPTTQYEVIKREPFKEVKPSWEKYLPYGLGFAGLLILVLVMKGGRR